MRMNWAVGKGYYMVKNSLLKRGFDIVDHEWQDRQRMLCRCKFDNGCETVELVYTVKPGKSGNLVCDKVVDVIQLTYDSLDSRAGKRLDEGADLSEKADRLVAKLRPAIAEAVRMALAETTL